MRELSEIIKRIRPLDVSKIKAGQQLCDQLAKPLGSLGKMETIYARLYAMFDGVVDLKKKIVMVYAADNGVVDEAISSNPQETTVIVSRNILSGKTGLCAISQSVGSSICLVDIGCKKDVEENAPNKVRYGTNNMVQKPAMTHEEAIQAILVGYHKTKEKIKEGYTLFGTGEMGIGNTTTSAAVISVLLHRTAKEVTGYGAGLTTSMKEHKASIIQQAVQRHAPYEDVLDVVSKVGGLDMLGIAGTFIACAEAQLPCVVDGLISITGLLIASQLTHHVLDYAFASHVSTEPGYALVCDVLQLEPMLLMEMRLGEGSGCPLAFSLMETSCYTMEHMPSFEEGQLKKEDYIDIRRKEKSCNYIRKQEIKA